MTRQKTAWFVQYKDNGEIIVVKRIICYLNPFKSKSSRQFLKEWKQNRPWLVKSPEQRLEIYCFCSVSYYYSFFPCTMNNNRNPSSAYLYAILTDNEASK
jgi:hypothetical protein